MSRNLTPRIACPKEQFNLHGRLDHSNVVLRITPLDLAAKGRAQGGVAAWAGHAARDSKLAALR